MNRVKLLGAGAITGLAAALVCSAPSYAVGQNPEPRGHHQRTLSFVIRQTQTSNVDVGTPGPSQGDESIFSGNLLRGANVVGHDNGVCTMTRVDPNGSGDQQCLVTLSFRRGSITVQGLTADSRSGFVLAVTGGTGRYRAASGYLHGDNSGDNTLIAVHLNR